MGDTHTITDIVSHHNAFIFSSINDGNVSLFKYENEQLQNICIIEHCKNIESLVIKNNGMLIFKLDKSDEEVLFIGILNLNAPHIVRYKIVESQMDEVHITHFNDSFIIQTQNSIMLNAIA